MESQESEQSGCLSEAERHRLSLSCLEAAHAFASVLRECWERATI
jgi:hypothetical protein